MNKKELVDKINEKTQIGKKIVEDILSAFTDTVIDTLKKNDKITLIGFGTFDAVTKSQRQGRNPQTGAIITIPERKVPKFTPGKTFKEAVK